jgi:hypothetical protein
MTQALVIAVCCVAGVLCLLAVVLAMMLVYKRNQLRELRLERQNKGKRRSSEDGRIDGKGIFKNAGAGGARVGHDLESIGSADERKDRERRRSNDLILQGASRALVGRSAQPSRTKKRSIDSVSSERTGRSDNRSNNAATTPSDYKASKKQANMNACQSPDDLSEIPISSVEQGIHSDEDAQIPSLESASLKPIRYPSNGAISSYHYIETVDENEGIDMEEEQDPMVDPVNEDPPSIHECEISVSNIHKSHDLPCDEVVTSPDNLSLSIHHADETVDQLESSDNMERHETEE